MNSLAGGPPPAPAELALEGLDLGGTPVLGPLELRVAKGETLAILGPSGIGKTSLLKILGKKLQDDGIMPIYLDLQMIQAKHTPRDFWDQVLRRLARRIRDDEIKDFVQALREEESIESFDLDDLFRDLEEAGLSIVLLLD